MNRNILLGCGVAAPLIYVGLAASGGLLFPGYDHAAQVISELGGPEAPHPMVFNLGLMAAGVLTLLGAAGLFLRLRGGAWLGALLAALAIATFGISILIGGVFPLPDPRHMAWGLGYAAQIAPLLTLWALWKTPGHAGLKGFLVFNLLVVNLALAVMFGVGNLVGPDNLGLWQRLYGLAVYPWIGVTALCLMRPSARLSPRFA
ncbi:DUF998 domain-containing protein [Brevundimonas sp.]|uniref:DUF998 domain-containing protein n=1 Tax=Brevundimonas sp. TaxID=1871086 RepID=UPI002ED94CB8